MASREEEKRKRREEREAQQRAADQSQARKRLVLVGLGVATVAAVLVIAGVLLFGGGGDDDMSVGSTGKTGGTASIPKQQETNFNAAVKAAGCTYNDFPDEGNTHQEETFTGYKTNPPTSGTHNPTPADDGVYDPGNSPAANNWVHSLEHGRIIIQYKQGTPANRIEQLKTLEGENVKGSPGYHMLLMENNTKMPYEVAALAWTRSLTCKTFNQQTFDAIRVFRDRFVDKGPEFIP